MKWLLGLIPLITVAVIEISRPNWGSIINISVLIVVDYSYVFIYCFLLVIIDLFMYVYLSNISAYSLFITINHDCIGNEYCRICTGRRLFDCGQVPSLSILSLEKSQDV